MEHDQAARKRLGREIRAARDRAGYTRSDFADKLKRSARQVQALENGETGVGPDTIAKAAEVLGWDVQRPYEILDGEQPDSSPPPSLAIVSDEELAAEVLRRMKAGERDADSAVPTIERELTAREKLQQVPKKAAKSKPRTDG